MSLAGSNATFAVYPGSDATMFILPDESLWRWGHGVKIPNGQPELFDDRHHWAKVFTRTDDCLEQETNGHVWNGRFGAWNLVPLPGTNQDWVNLTGDATYLLGLQGDGTIQGWELNNASAGATNPVTEAQTNYLWRAVSANGAICLGVSSDGRLWSWNRTGFSPLAFSNPRQESSSTNWVGVADGCYGWSSSGELWGAPVARLNSSNAINGRFALGSVVHEIRHDGTLWAIGEWGHSTRRFVSRLVASGFYINGYASSGSASMPNSRKSQWRKIGDRSDWVSIWGSEETYFGLTSDGTVWVWGIDWGQRPIVTLKDRLNYLWERLRDHLHPATTGGGTMVGRSGVRVIQPYQNEPRPLMRFKTVNQ
jgi:hypothetical protein